MDHQKLTYAPNGRLRGGTACGGRRGGQRARARCGRARRHVWVCRAWAARPQAAGPPEVARPVGRGPSQGTCAPAQVLGTGPPALLLGVSPWTLKEPRVSRAPLQGLSVNPVLRCWHATVALRRRHPKRAWSRHWALVPPGKGLLARLPLAKAQGILQGEAWILHPQKPHRDQGACTHAHERTSHGLKSCHS